jgi:dTDP-4-dehydrorhamnose reductase
MTRARWLVTGANGQLGHHLAAVLDGAGADAVCLTRAELDITSRAEVDDAVEQHRPDVVVNAAAYTAVDAAEDDEDRALAVNRDGPANLAAALAPRTGKLVHVSTDYVFDGRATRPYEPDDPTGPQTAYGRTKLAGEQAAVAQLPDRCVVVRTAWVYGGPGPNFVDTMLRLERERDTVDVVADQHGSPTWSADLAAALVAVGASPVARGTLHYANGGNATWHDLARETFRLAGADPARVHETTSDRFVRPAPRPAWSVLSTRSWTDAGLPAPRPWAAALADCLAARSRN